MLSKCSAVRGCSTVSLYYQRKRTAEFFAVSDTPTFVYSVLGVGILCSVLLSLGIGRRWVALFLWVIWLSLFNRNPFIGNPSIPFIGVALLLMAALPSGEPLAQRKPEIDWHVPNWVAHAGLTLLMLGYTVSGLHKLTASLGRMVPRSHMC